MRQLVSLQVLRGMAALFVVLYHATRLFEHDYNFRMFDGFFHQGWWGVDLFFVISGFIIFYIHHNDIGNKQKLNSFARKRFLRIFPVYWIVTLMVLPILFVFPSLGVDSAREAVVILKSMVLFPQEAHPVVGVAWSLSHEIFFYFMFSLLIFAPKKWSHPIIALWISITLIFYTLSLVAEVKLNYYVDFIFSAYNLEFVFGSMVAFTVARYSRQLRGSVFIAIAVLGVGLTWIVSYAGIVAPDRVVSWGLLSALLILGCVLLESKRNIKVPNIFTYLGDASYSIYLVHGYTLSIADKIVMKVFPQISQFSAFLIVFFAVIGGCIFYSLIEKPLLNILLHRKRNKKRDPAIAA